MSRPQEVATAESIHSDQSVASLSALLGSAPRISLSSNQDVATTVGESLQTPHASTHGGPTQARQPVTGVESPLNDQSVASLMVQLESRPQTGYHQSKQYVLSEVGASLPPQHTLSGSIRAPFPQPSTMEPASLRPQQIFPAIADAPYPPPQKSPNITGASLPPHQKLLDNAETPLPPPQSITAVPFQSRQEFLATVESSPTVPLQLSLVPSTSLPLPQKLSVTAGAPHSPEKNSPGTIPAPALLSQTSPAIVGVSPPMPQQSPVPTTLLLPQSLASPRVPSSFTARFPSQRNSVHPKCPSQHRRVHPKSLGQRSASRSASVSA